MPVLVRNPGFGHGYVPPAPPTGITLVGVSLLTGNPSRTTVTVPIPAGTVTGDFMLVRLETTQTISGVPSGWTLAPGTWPATYTTFQADKLYYYWKFHDGTEVDPAFTQPSGYSQANMMSYRKVDIYSPFDVTPVTSTGTGASGVATGLTTVTDMAKVILVINDSGFNGAPPHSAPSGPPTFTKIFEATGGTVGAIFDGDMITAGATGNKSVSNIDDGSSGWGWMMNMMALRYHDPAMISRVAKSFVPFGPGTGITVPIPTGTDVGDLMLAHIEVGGAGPTNPNDLTLPSGWAYVTGSAPYLYPNPIGGSSYQQDVYLCYRFFQAGDSNPTWTGSTSYQIQGLIVSYRGVDPTTPFDTTTSLAQGSGATSTNPGAITTTANAKIVLFGSDSNVSGGGNVPAGTTPKFSFIQTNTDGLMVADGDMVTAGSTGALSFTNGDGGAGQPWQTSLVALRKGSPSPTLAYFEAVRALVPGLDTIATSSLSWSAGDLIIVRGAMQNGGSAAILSIVNQTGLSFTAVSAAAGISSTQAWGRAWYAIATASSSGPMMADYNGGTNRNCTLLVEKWTGASGIGATAGAVVSGTTPTQALTVSAGSSVSMSWADFNVAAAGSSPAAGLSGTFTETQDSTGTGLTVWGGAWKGVSAGAQNWGSDVGTGRLLTMTGTVEILP